MRRIVGLPYVSTNLQYTQHTGWQNGLIVEFNGKARSVGKSQLHHNLYPVDAVLIKGEPLRVITQRVDMKGRSLRWLVENLKANHGYYLLGELYVDADKVVNVS